MSIVSFTKKEIKIKLTEIEEELKSTQDQLEYTKTRIQMLINSDPQIQQAQQKLNRLAAQANRIQGRKDFWLDLSDMGKKDKKKKPTKGEKK